MGFYRFFPTKDTYITNKIFDENSPTVRATGSNFGRSPLIKIFKITGSFPDQSVELARGLVQFDISKLYTKIFTDKSIPSSSVSYILNMFDYKHDGLNPSSFDLCVYPISRSFDEGNGIDDDLMLDFGYCNWLSASSTQGWSNDGSDSLTTYGTASAHFDYGDEDLQVDITPIVNNWLSYSVNTTGIPNYGLLIRLSASNEENGTDYYTKIFHARETKYVDKIPFVEARWDSDIVKDNRQNFAYNQNSSLYFYNFVRGQLANVNEPLWVRIRDNLVAQSSSYSVTFTASRVDTGIYSCSFNISNTASFSGTWYDVWHSASFCYMTGVFTPLVLTGSQVDTYDDFDVSMPNAKRAYDSAEQSRIKVLVRKKNKYTHIRPSSSLETDRQYIESMYYRILNDETKQEVIPFGTGSVKYTQLSYNKEGNYFDFDFSSLVPGFVYRIQFLIDINKYDEKIIDNNFLFKVK